MKRRLLAEATRLGLLDSRNKGSCTAFQRFKCIAPECEKAAEKKCCLHTDLQDLHAQLSALRKGASSYWSNIDKHLLQEPLKKKVASLQDEIQGLRADMAASFRDTVSARDDIASMDFLISSLRADMSQGHKEHLDLWTRINTQVGFITADVSGLCEQVSKLQEEMKGQCHSADAVKSDLNGTAAVMKADMAKIDPHIAPRLFNLLQEQVTGLRADMSKGSCRVEGDVASLIKQLDEDITGLRVDVANLSCEASSGWGLHTKIDLTLASMESLQKEIKRLTADMAKLICHRGADVALPPVISQLQPIDVGMVPSSPVALEDKDLSTKIDKNLRGLQELPAPALMTMTPEKDSAFKADMEESLMNLSKSFREARKQMDVIGEEAKVPMDLLNKMHAKMERLCGVVETMNGNANVVWSNVIAQEKETQELMHTLLSNVESYATDKERANVVLVKIVSAFLVCTTAFYAWIVWSFNSCYPL